MRSFSYGFKQALKQVGRNGAMSLASFFSIIAMTLILGVFFIALVNINLAMDKAKQDYDQIQVYLFDSTSLEDAENIQSELSAMPEVSEAYYLSKDEAMAEWKAEWGESAYLLDSLSTNPLPNAIVIKVAELEGASSVAERAGSFEGVEDVVYYQDTVDKLSKVTNALQIAAWVIMAFLVMVCVVVVSNTIKLTVFARAEEINIMKYVGATNWFIRGPFIIEGMLIGLISALISAGITGFLYSKIIEIAGEDIFLMFNMRLMPLDFFAINLLWIFVALGISVGAVGSLVSVRRFLD